MHAVNVHKDGPNETAKSVARTGESERQHTRGPNALWQALALTAAALRPKLAVSQPDDPYERQADRVADQVTRMTAPRPTNLALPFSSQVPGQAQRECAGREEEREGEGTSRRKGQGGGADSLTTAPPTVREALGSPGRPLDPVTRAFMEMRFGHDFNRVRVHVSAKANELNQRLQARAFTIGSDIFFRDGHYDPGRGGGRKLLAHELTHVVQQGGARALGGGAVGSRAGLHPGRGPMTAARPQPGQHGTRTLVQRAIMLTTPSAGRHRMLAPERAAFIARHISRGDRPLAQRVLDDMDAAGDTFDFADERELELELIKRVETSQLMQETQAGPGGTAFGYPFNPPAELYGPRVNYAARTYWTPPPPDGYADRSRDPRAARARRTPRGLRHIVFGDMGADYEWSLTPAGIADFHQALSQLFVPQPQPYRRSLIHCDYLVSLVHFRALATAIGATRFNAAARAYGANRLRLRWNLYTDLYADNFSGFRWWIATTRDPSRAPAAALGSLAEVRPSSISDLVIGDHVVFWNHEAYDALNARIGNAWRLENAVLIDRRGGRDLFLGHGSGTKTERQMREKLAEEYNQVADIALGLVSRATRGPASGRAAARAELSRRFPHLEEDGGRWWIRVGGVWGFFRSVNQPLGRITASDVPGLHDPADRSRMNPVQRPAESRT